MATMRPRLAYATMSKILWSLVAAGLLAVGVANCGSGGGGGGGSGSPLAGDLCKKADACGSLSGITAARCQDVVNKSLQSMTSAARSDAEKALNACLAMADCGGLSTCMEAALQGSGGSAGSGGRATGGSTAASSGGSGTCKLPSPRWPPTRPSCGPSTSVATTISKHPIGIRVVTVRANRRTIISTARKVGNSSGTGSFQG